MVQVIQALREDHKALADLLRYLEHQIDAQRSQEQPDFALIGHTLERCLNQVVASQARKTELILQRLRARKETAAEAVGPKAAERAAEHDRLVELTKGFSAAVAEMQQRAIDRRPDWHDELDRFGRASVLAFWDYMQRTEQLVLPVAMLMLTEEDWTRVDAQLEDLTDPPA